MLSRASLLATLTSGSLPRQAPVVTQLAIRRSQTAQIRLEYPRPISPWWRPPPGLVSNTPMQSSAAPYQPSNNTSPPRTTASSRRLPSPSCGIWVAHLGAAHVVSADALLEYLYLVLELLH